MRIARHALLSLALAGALGLAACGSDDDSSGDASQEAKTTPAQAVVEIGLTRQALDDGVAALRDGDRATAEDTVAEGYLQHFEKVEGPLKDVDEELSEEIEETINQEIRDKIKNGASVEEVAGVVNETKANLAKAVTALKQ
jgi:DNA anti-recombination protein RmuC